MVEKDAEAQEKRNRGRNGGDEFGGPAIDRKCSNYEQSGQCALTCQIDEEISDINSPN